MRKPVGLETLYLDFDSFFASAEQLLQPDLRDRPVGIVPLESAATSLIAVSREAKAFGIRTGTKVREARALCPGIVLVAARHDVYVRLHRRIIDIIDSVVPVKAIRSIDEVVAALLDNEQSRATDLARDVKAALAARIGPTLTCSIGLAPNELLAKIGAEMNKPDGLVTIRPDDLPGKILHLPLTDIPGIAHGNADRLARAGITDMAGLWTLAPKQMRAIWGGVEGERFWASLHGYAMERPATRRGMFGHSRILPWDWRSPDCTRDCARLLLVKAARRMRREGYAARALTLSLRAEDGQRWSAEKGLVPACREDHAVLDALNELFGRAKRQYAARRSKSVAVMLHGLVSQDEAASDLFTTDVENGSRARWERLADVGDRLSARYGRDILTLGLQPQPPGGYAGGKIAFGRIPDLADFG
jgi:DNA polymerase IV